MRHKPVINQPWLVLVLSTCTAHSVSPSCAPACVCKASVNIMSAICIEWHMYRRLLFPNAQSRRLHSKAIVLMSLIGVAWVASLVGLVVRTFAIRVQPPISVLRCQLVGLHIRATHEPMVLPISCMRIVFSPTVRSAPARSFRSLRLEIQPPANATGLPHKSARKLAGAPHGQRPV